MTVEYNMAAAICFQWKIEDKELSKNRLAISHLIFRPFLAYRQSQNSKRSTATPVVLPNQFDLSSSQFERDTGLLIMVWKSSFFIYT